MNNSRFATLDNNAKRAKLLQVLVLRTQGALSNDELEQIVCSINPNKQYKIVVTHSRSVFFDYINLRPNESIIHKFLDYNFYEGCREEKVKPIFGDNNTKKVAVRQVLKEINSEEVLSKLQIIIYVPKMLRYSNVSPEIQFILNNFQIKDVDAQ